LIAVENDDQPRRQRETWIAAAIAAVASLIAFLYYFHRGEIMLYGDAVAHINIARRVLDSREPGIAQLGTVWLPLPHILQIPFIWMDPLWRSGIAGSIPSMVAYVLGAVGIFRLLRVRTTQYTAWVGFAIYAGNPSLLYMQSTAMTESIFLAALIWAVFYTDEFKRGVFPPSYGYGLPATIPAWRALERCGMCLAAAIFTRYDGWVFAAIVGILNISVFLRWRKAEPQNPGSRRMARSLATFVIFCALVPVFWLAHNYHLSGRPLDWLNGPYSAKAIEARTSQPGAPPYPGKNSIKVASQYFIKSAVMNMSEGKTAPWILAFALLGTIIVASHIGRLGALLLFWIPLPFYAYSVAYGSVPIFLPTWWPYSYYNVRYGLELLPMFAVMIALAVMSVSGIRVKRVGAIFSAVAVVVVGYAYLSSWRGDSHYYDWGVRAPWPGPICYREALVNSRTRLGVEKWLADEIKLIPPDSSVVMYTSQYVGALQRAEFPLKRVVNESSFVVWQAALSAPAGVAEYTIAIDNDPVAQAVSRNPYGLTLVDRRAVDREPEIAIYKSSVVDHSGLKR
jgi:hypothetical protein